MSDHNIRKWMQDRNVCKWIPNHNIRKWMQDHNIFCRNLIFHLIINNNYYLHPLFPGRSFRTTPSLSLKYSNFTWDIGLVDTSATCSSVGTYGYLWILSTPYSRCNYTLSLCDLTYHWNLGSLLTWYNSICHNKY